ncbi:SDR family oxidoreductase [Oceaniglobus indicus]|uniref:SDR family oxidoreductase n=1 Tax=Oceaniglobus indicus TaxID=2047749 RepID=UPI000C1A1862|nr:SDR family oxidoreductase [Oceaniglobus indicus]
MNDRRRALVTGGGKRLGRAMALYLASRGYDVAVHYNTSSTAADEVAQDICARGQAACTLGADLLDEAATTALVGRATDALGGAPDVLVNNASIFEYDTLADATRDTWDRHMGSNLRAPFVLTQAMARVARDPVTDTNGEPRARSLVVNMIDQRVRKPTPEFMTYTLAKMALWAFTQTAAQALAPRVRINAIGPGPTLRGGRQDATAFARQRAATILERGANPDDIVAALGYFLDAPAVTGQLLCVDGGQHLAWQTADVLGVE